MSRPSKRKLASQAKHRAKRKVVRQWRAWKQEHERQEQEERQRRRWRKFKMILGLVTALITAYGLYTVGLLKWLLLAVSNLLLLSMTMETLDKADNDHR